MDQTLLIILGVVLLAVVGFFVMRKPKELPPKEGEAPAPKLEAKGIEDLGIETRCGLQTHTVYQILYDTQCVLSSTFAYLWG